MALEDYTTGTVSISNGSTALTGAGTAWEVAAFKAGDTFYKDGYAILIASVDSDTGITLADAWPGTALSGATYVIRYQPDNSRMQGTTRQLLDELRQGIWLTPDATGKTADKATYDDRAAGFRFLDVSVDPFKLYVKESDTSGDWSAGADWVGPAGDPGPQGADGDITWEGAWVTAAAYTANQAVSEGGSSYVCIVNHTSGTFATDLAADKWELMAQKGDKGDVGDPGTPGTPGSDGTDGLGVPAGGAEGQVLAKKTATDNDTEWIDPPASGVTSITAGNGISVDDTDPAAPVVTALVRELLTSDRTYYVATTGSDTNDGLTSGTAFATPQKAVTVAFATLDLNGHNVTIQLADGTYTSTVSQTSPQVGAGTIKLSGNTTTPGNVLFSLAAQTAINLDGYGTKLAVEGVRLAFSGNGIGLAVTNGAYLTVTGNMDFGPALWHTRVDGLSTLRFAANYTISGGANRHYFVGTNSKIEASLRTVTLTGTPAFSDAFAYAELGGVVFGLVMTFSGSASGSRYQAKNGGIINSGGGGASYFPGSTAGTGTNMGASPYGLYL